MRLAGRDYQPREAERGVLHTVVPEHLGSFLQEAAERGAGAGLPSFVEQEFRDFFACGVLAGGSAVTHCAYPSRYAGAREDHAAAPLPPG